MQSVEARKERKTGRERWKQWNHLSTKHCKQVLATKWESSHLPSRPFSYFWGYDNNLHEFLCVSVVEHGLAKPLAAAPANKHFKIRHTIAIPVPWHKYSQEINPWGEGVGGMNYDQLSNQLPCSSHVFSNPCSSGASPFLDMGHITV